MTTPHVKKTPSALVKYVHSLCDNFIPQDTESNHRRFRKACGEFALLCYIYKTKLILPKSYYLACVKIEKTFRLHKFDTTSMLSINFIFEFINLNTSELHFERVEALDKSFNKNVLGMEAAFIKERFMNNLDSSYWKFAAIEIIKGILENGMDDKDFYNITHLIFFATQFGQREWRAVCSDLLIDTYREFLKKIEADAIRRQYWDLLLEVYLCNIYISKECHSFTKPLIDNKLNLIPNYDGRVLTKGDNHNDFIFSYNTPYDDRSYSLYHTNLVREILLIELGLIF